MMTKYDIINKIVIDFKKQYNLDYLNYLCFHANGHKPVTAFIWHKLHKQVTKNEIEWQLLEKYLKDNGLNKYFKITSHNDYEIDLVETDVDDSNLKTLFTLKEKG
jgi:hypothetical protein